MTWRINQFFHFWTEDGKNHLRKLLDGDQEAFKLLNDQILIPPDEGLIKEIEYYNIKIIIKYKDNSYMAFKVIEFYTDISDKQLQIEEEQSKLEEEQEKFKKEQEEKEFKEKYSFDQKLMMESLSKVIF